MESLNAYRERLHLSVEPLHAQREPFHVSVEPLNAYREDFRLSVEILNASVELLNAYRELLNFTSKQLNMGLHRVPQKDEDFNHYINNTADYLQKVDSGTGVANWQRLSLVAEENTQWEEFRTAWNEAYDTYRTNLHRGIRDSSVTETKNKQRKDFSKWVTKPAMNLLNRIKNGPEVKAKDRAIFHIRLRETNPGPRPAITTAPAVDLRSGGGGIVVITCRVESDNDRASRHPHSDGIEMRYILTKADGQPPTGPEECQSMDTSTRAIFRFEGGVGHPGKRLYAYLRWQNGRDQNKSGPWSQVVTTIVGD